MTLIASAFALFGCLSLAFYGQGYPGVGFVYAMISLGWLAALVSPLFLVPLRDSLIAWAKARRFTKRDYYRLIDALEAAGRT